MKVYKQEVGALKGWKGGYTQEIPTAMTNILVVSSRARRAANFRARSFNPRIACESVRSVAVEGAWGGVKMAVLLCRGP